jgi:hypothetical protein
MQMEDGLSSAGAGIDDRAVAILQIAFARELRGDKLEFAEQRLVGCGRFMQGGKMLARAQQNVSRSLRADVFEGKKVGVFIDDLGGNFIGGNITKKAIDTH